MSVLTSKPPRASRFTRGRIAALATLALATAVVVDACFIEPNDVVVERSTWKTNVRSPLVVAHLSDLHAHGFGTREERAIALLNEAHPDVVVVSGDVVDNGNLEHARAFFEKLHAPLGVLVVRGNWEHWQRVEGERAFYASVHATLLVDEGISLRDDVWVAGMDDESTTEPNLRKALLGKPAGTITMGLFHSPSFFDHAHTGLDVAFAGHTHGGQIRVPFMAPLFLPWGSGRFVEGDYTALDGTSHLHVSRGLGTSTVPARFACKPEIAIVRLEPR